MKNNSTCQRDLYISAIASANAIKDSTDNRAARSDEFIKQRLFGTVALVSNITPPPDLINKRQFNQSPTILMRLRRWVGSHIAGCTATFLTTKRFTFFDEFPGWVGTV